MGVAVEGWSVSEVARGAAAGGQTLPDGVGLTDGLGLTDGVALPRGAAGELLEERFRFGADRTVSLLRPRSADAVMDELIANGEENDDRLPFWAELWPSGTALARAVAARPLRGTRVLELGCGLGLVSVAAAMAGARVLAADRSEEAVAFTHANAARNQVTVQTVTCAFDEPAALLAEAPWELVLAADVLYEPRNIPVLLWLLPRLVGEDGEIWLADPGRNQTGGFITAIDATGWHREELPTHPDDSPRVTIHRLRKTAGARRPGSGDDEPTP